MTSKTETRGRKSFKEQISKENNKGIVEVPSVANDNIIELEYLHVDHFKEIIKYNKDINSLTISFVFNKQECIIYGVDDHARIFLKTVIDCKKSISYYINQEYIGIKFNIDISGDIVKILNDTFQSMAIYYNLKDKNKEAELVLTPLKSKNDKIRYTLQLSQNNIEYTKFTYKKDQKLLYGINLKMDIIDTFQLWYKINKNIVLQVKKAADEKNLCISATFDDSNIKNGKIEIGDITEKEEVVDNLTALGKLMMVQKISVQDIHPFITSKLIKHQRRIEIYDTEIRLILAIEDITSTMIIVDQPLKEEENEIVIPMPTSN